MTYALDILRHFANLPGFAVSCEKDFRRLPSTRIIKETTPIAELLA